MNSWTQADTPRPRTSLFTASGRKRKFTHSTRDSRTRSRLDSELAVVLMAETSPGGAVGRSSSMTMRS